MLLHCNKKRKNLRYWFKIKQGRLNREFFRESNSLRLRDVTQRWYIITRNRSWNTVQYGFDSSPSTLYNMSSIATSLLKVTVGFLVRKGRDLLAEKLKEGDILDHKIRALIVREIDDVKSKLDGLARKDLLAAIDYFEEGLGLIFEVLQAQTPPSPNDETKTFCLTLTMRNLDTNDLDETAKTTLANAKKRFDDARRSATEAFNDEALKPSERIAAMGYRILATILEAVESPLVALPACRSCIEKLNSLPAVQNCFTVALKKSLLGRFSKEERREIILSVCRLNRIVYDYMFMVYGFGNKDVSGISQLWPCIETESEHAKVNPLSDARLMKVLMKLDMKHNFLQWSFGQEGEEEHMLKEPWGMATNTSGDFIVADNKDRNVKVFNSSGKFLYSFSPVTDEVTTAVFIYDVATDKYNNIYVLVTAKKPVPEQDEEESYVYMKTPNRMFPLKEGFSSWSFTWSSLVVADKDKILVRGGLVTGQHVVDIYTTDGQFVRRFGEGALQEVSSSIAAANDGGVIVATGGHNSYCVNTFSKKGKRLRQFKVERSFHYPQTTFHQASDHVVVAGIHVERGKENRLEIVIFTKEGEYVRSIQHEEEDIVFLRGITVTTGGRVAVVYRDKLHFKVLVA